MWLGEDTRGWDHIRVHVQLYRDERVGAYELAVYGGIALHAETATGEASPSHETLAGYAQCDERTVRRVVKRLQEWGYIAVIPRPGQASIYKLLPPPALDHQSGVDNADDESADSQSGVQPDQPQSDALTSADSGSGVDVAASADSQSGVVASADSQSGPPRTEVPRTPDSQSDELDRTSELDKTKPQNASTSSRPRDEIWDTLDQIFGEPTTASQRRLRNKVVAELRKSTLPATPTEIGRQVRAYRQRFPRVSLTETALLKWWGKTTEPHIPTANRQRQSTETCPHGIPLLHLERGLQVCTDCSAEIGRAS